MDLSNVTSQHSAPMDFPYIPTNTPIYKVSFDPTLPGIGYNTTKDSRGRVRKTHPAKGQWYVFERFRERGKPDGPRLFTASTFPECIAWIDQQRNP